MNKNNIFFPISIFFFIFIVSLSLFITYQFTHKKTADIYYQSQTYPINSYLQVNNNGNDIDMSNYWPMKLNSNTKFHGYTKKGVTQLGYGEFKMQLTINKQRIYEGKNTYPIYFIKDKPYGYWDPHNDQNLAWFVSDFNQNTTGKNFFYAVGDKRYDRTALPDIKLLRRFRYDSLDSRYPAYALFPKTLKPNPTGDLFTNLQNNMQRYSNCSYTDQTKECTLVKMNQNNGWAQGIMDAQIDIPYYKGPAKRIEFVEYALPFGTSLKTPFSSDRKVACTVNGDHYKYAGVREDWYFVKNEGPLLIYTREFLDPKKDPCIYDVIREDLTVNNAYVYLYAVDKDFNQYDPSWNF